MGARAAASGAQPDRDARLGDVSGSAASPALNLDDAAVRERLAVALANGSGADTVAIGGWTKLSGGAIQQNLALDVRVSGGALAGSQRWVLRTDAPSKVAASRSRAEEFALLTVASAAGVVTPQPLFHHAADGVLPDYFVMTRAKGTAAGHRLTRDDAIGDRAALVRELGANLARIHAIRPPQPALDFLGAPSSSPTLDALAGYRAYLDHWRNTFGDAHPVLEWGLAWLVRRTPNRENAVLVHRDYRVGNLMVDQGRLTATLDWEFAGWGNPMEDLGWLCARCWRFARPDRVAGGLGDAGDFLDGYNAVAGTHYAEPELLPWQVLAQLRWAVIALQQAERFLSGRERSIELALTGRLLPELELEILALTGDRLG